MTKVHELNQLAGFIKEEEEVVQGNKAVDPNLTFFKLGNPRRLEIR